MKLQKERDNQVNKKSMWTEVLDEILFKSNILENSFRFVISISMWSF